MNTETLYRDVQRQSRVNQQPVPYFRRDPDESIYDFGEVVLGYDEETAILEASRCMQCPAPQPCLLGCPAGNDIPEAIWLISEGHFAEAGAVFAQTNPLSEICGRVCPNLCQQGCVLNGRNGPISIGKLEILAGEAARAAGLLTIPVPDIHSGKQVAIVGSGPAGLTAAEDLARLGHEVTIFEAWPEPGGVLVYGIPSFKLEKQVVEQKIADLEQAGVEFITNQRIGKDLPVETLLSRYDAVFLGTGAGVQATMGVAGETLDGVYKSTDFLVRANVAPEKLPPHLREKPAVGRRVAVIGGGDTAVDCARTALRLGAEQVRIIYRRTEAEMPGNPSERALCLAEGASVSYLQAPVAYVGDDLGRVQSMQLVEMTLGEPDRSGRRRPIPNPDSEFNEPIDTVVLAVGYWPDPALGEQTDGLATDRYGLITADPATGATSRAALFAAGDNVHGPDLVITAVADAHRAARAIHTYLNE